MIKRFILWDFPRGGWQYDVMVGIILAFIFLTPREWFRDQPRIPNAISVDVRTGPANAHVLWVEPEMLAGIPEDQQVSRLTQLLRSRTHDNQLAIVKVETIYDSEREIKGYLAVARH